MAARGGRWLSGLVLVVLLVLAGAPVAPVQGGAEHYLYLPLVINHFGPPGLWGYVTHNGVPAGGVALALYRQPPSALAVHVADATTQADGLYVFDGLPALPAGHTYLISYTNTTDSSRLASAYSRSIDTYTPGDSVRAAIFDVANVPLVGPADGAQVWFPHSLTWTKRPASPGDSYLVAYFTAAGVPLMSTGGLGWYDSYYVFALPQPLSYHTPYRWTVHVLLPGAGFGLNFESRAICFGTCPALAETDWRPAWPALLP